MITSSNNNTFINTSAISESGRGIYLSSSNNNNFVSSSGRTYAYDYPISLFSSIYATTPDPINVTPLFTLLMVLL